ncbi:MAG: NHLP bacteriocin export ABC transporter permease/ATPase subunit, partial [Armatimonadetes bacterium]|nr:NHLP bacteriocin export ABC transporter permease/ATPase subunit [Armatimonadota bacterium]
MTDNILADNDVVAQLFASSGSTVPLDGTARPAVPETAAWRIAAGTLSLCLQPQGNDEGRGRRSFLFSLETGELALHISDATADGVTYTVSAVASAECRVEALPLAALQTLARSQPALVAPLLEGWVRTLSEAAHPDAPPVLSRTLPSDGVVEAARNEALRGGRRTVWIKHRKGQSRLFGKGPTWDASAAALPVGPGAWIQVDADATLEVTPTEIFVPQDDAWTAVKAISTAMGGLLVSRRQSDEALDLQRIQTWPARSDALQRKAWQELSVALQSGPPTEADKESEDPLLAACKLVGGRLGREVRAARPNPTRDPLTEIARVSRLRVRRVDLEHGWWRQDAGPLVGWLKDGLHPVALLPIRPGRYELMDTATGKARPVDARVADELAPKAGMFYLQLPNRPVTILEVLRLSVADAGGDLLSLLVVCALMALLALAVPVATEVIYNHILPVGEVSHLATVIQGLMVVIFATTMFTVARGVALLRFGGRFDARIAGAMFDRLMTLPMPFYRQYSIGDLASRSMGITEISRLVTGGALNRLLSSVFSVFSLALLFRYSVPLALVACVLLSANIAFSWWLSARQLVYQRQVADKSGEVSGVLFQILSALAKIRVAGAESNFLAYWAEGFSQQMALQYRAGLLTAVQTTVSTAFPVFCTLIFFSLVGAGFSMTTGGLLAFLAAFGQCAHGVEGIVDGGIQIVESLPLVERSRPILEIPPEVDESKTDPGDLTGRIEMVHVSFRYKEGDPLILDDVSFRIEPGQFVAFVGPTGAGKSTTLNLLLGFDVPTGGSVFYDGKDLRTLDLQAVRQQTGVVLQNDRIMKQTVFYNIVGARPLTLDDAWTAARMVGLDKDIEAMPMGMNTVVSDATFSGGQAQRLLIARAIVSRPRIFLFDEATSALDNETQAIVSRSMEELSTTRIVIAHRLSTIRHADR